MLLERNTFREKVFERDNYKCVICGANAQDAHHIIERRLWSNGGYYLDNGASLCGKCHILAEKTLLSCQQIREAAKIKNIVKPEHLYDDYEYDKWGNIILANGNRLKGELFFDESVQKILSEVIHLFIKYIKYPRTYHLPWSESKTDDDRTIENIDNFVGKEIVITEKMDGENTTLYDDYIHARSIDSESHESQSWVRNLQNKIGYNIPKDWRICGENLFAKHSIFYDNLKTYFFAFSIWNEKNICLSWKDTLEWCSLLELEHVPVLYEGIFDLEKLPKINKEFQEGYVIRLKDSFSYFEFKKSVAKFVRQNHVKDTVHNWKRTMLVKNKLKI